MNAPTIVVAGSLAQKAGQGGFAWVFLQYVLGFRRLGWEVLFIDRLEPGMCVDVDGRPCPFDRSANLRYFLRIMGGFDLEGSFSLIYNGGERLVGLSREEVLELTRSSRLLLNVMGFLDDEEVLRSAPRRVFLDIDPGFGQMWRELGLADPFAGHDVFVTIGENIGRPECPIPTCGLEWITTPQPVVLDEWPAQSGVGGRFTSVGSWRGAYGPVEYRGRTYGLRVHEFRKFADLPRMSGRPFELALDIHPNETNDLALLEDGGWSLVAPRDVAGDPWAYRAYVQGSRAEFAVAKNMYVQSESGWLSDRSLCYLASGKPVVVQDTGLGSLYPTGEGLLTFTSRDEALSAVEEVDSDYERHAQAARALAEDHFDSDKVLPRLLDRLGAG